MLAYRGLGPGGLQQGAQGLGRRGVVVDHQRQRAGERARSRQVGRRRGEGRRGGGRRGRRSHGVGTGGAPGAHRGIVPRLRVAPHGPGPGPVRLNRGGRRRRRIRAGQRPQHFEFGPHPFARAQGEPAARALHQARQHRQAQAGAGPPLGGEIGLEDFPDPVGRNPAAGVADPKSGAGRAGGGRAEPQRRRAGQRIDGGSSGRGGRGDRLGFGRREARRRGWPQDRCEVGRGDGHGRRRQRGRRGPGRMGGARKARVQSAAARLRARPTAGRRPARLRRRCRVVSRFRRHGRVQHHRDHARRPALRHRVAGVDHQVEQHLQEIGGVDAGAKRRLRGFDMQVDLGRQTGAHQVGGVVQRRAEIGLGPRRRAPAHRQKARDQVRRPPARRQDPLRMPPLRRGGGDRARDHRRRAGDRGEKVVEIMRDPRRQHPDRLMPLGGVKLIAQPGLLGLRPPPFGGVAAHADQAEALDQGQRNLLVHRAAVPPPALELTAPGAAGLQLGQDAADQPVRPVRGVEVEPGTPQRRRLILEPEHRPMRGVHVDDAPRLIGDGDAVLGRVHRRRAPGQHPLGGLEAGDVDRHGHAAAIGGGLFGHQQDAAVGQRLLPLGAAGAHPLQPGAGLGAGGVPRPALRGEAGGPDILEPAPGRPGRVAGGEEIAIGRVGEDHPPAVVEQQEPLPQRGQRVDQARAGAVAVALGLHAFGDVDLGGDDLVDAPVGVEDRVQRELVPEGAAVTRAVAQHEAARRVVLHGLAQAGALGAVGGLVRKEAAVAAQRLGAGPAGQGLESAVDIDQREVAAGGGCGPRRGAAGGLGDDDGGGGPLDHRREQGVALGQRVIGEHLGGEPGEAHHQAQVVVAEPGGAAGETGEDGGRGAVLRRHGRGDPGPHGRVARPGRGRLRLGVRRGRRTGALREPRGHRRGKTGERVARIGPRRGRRRGGRGRGGRGRGERGRGERGLAGPGFGFGGCDGGGRGGPIGPAGGGLGRRGEVRAGIDAATVARPPRLPRQVVEAGRVGAHGLRRAGKPARQTQARGMGEDQVSSLRRQHRRPVAPQGPAQRVEQRGQRLRRPVGGGHPLQPRQQRVGFAQRRRLPRAAAFELRQRAKQGLVLRHPSHLAMRPNGIVAEAMNRLG